MLTPPIISLILQILKYSYVQYSTQQCLNRSQLMNWAEEEGGWEKVVRPMVVETIAWAETQFGKPQTVGNKWVIFGELQPPIRRVIHFRINN